MGIPTKSRKGKKAWRKNIDAKEVEEFLVQESHKQVREPAVESLKDEDLFVVDKEADDAAVPASVRSSKRKQAQQKLLRPAAILASHKDGIKPLHVPTKHKAKGPAKPLPSSVMPAGGAAAAEAAAQQAAEAAAAAAAGRGKRKPARRQGLKVLDIWSQAGPDPDQDWTAPTTGIALIKLGKRKQQQQQVGAVTTAAAAADGAADGAPAAVAPAAKRSKRRAAAAAAAAAPIVPAVEVDAPGCSFNPEPEAHQDALAAAVAAEYRKQLADELAPKAPSQFAPAGYKAPQDELDALLVDAEMDEEEEDEDEAAAAAAAGAQMQAAMQDENAIPLDDSEDEDGGGGGGDGGAVAAAGAAGGSKAAGSAAAAGRSSGGGAGGGRSDRKTRKDRNREARRKQQEADTAAKAALKQQRRELEALAELQQQLAQEDQEKEAVRLRRQATVAERAANEPPRLGKHRFEAAPVAVMTTDEVTGSLREIKPCFTLTADRFKALQKRGLVEPRKPSGRKLGKKIEYVTGDRQEKAREAQQEIEDLKKARKKAAKSGSAAAAEAVVAMAGGGKGSSRRARQKQKQQEQQLAKKMQLAPGSIMPLEVAAAGTAAGGDEGW